MPVCRPIRTRMVASSGHGAARSRSLALDGRGEGVGGRGEGDEQRVALRLELGTAVVGPGRPEEPVVLVEQRLVPVSEATEQARGPLDVGEEEGHRSRRQCRAHRDRMALRLTGAGAKAGLGSGGGAWVVAHARRASRMDAADPRRGRGGREGRPRGRTRLAARGRGHRRAGAGAGAAHRPDRRAGLGSCIDSRRRRAKRSRRRRRPDRGRHRRRPGPERVDRRVVDQWLARCRVAGVPPTSTSGDADPREPRSS